MNKTKTPHDFFMQSSSLVNRLQDLRDTFEKYSPEWFRIENIRSKAFKRFLRRYDWAEGYNPFLTLYKPAKTESGDPARCPASVVALVVETGSHHPTTEQGSTTHDIRHIEYFDDVEITHHIICYSIPSSVSSVYTV
jgi:hypothetical protein